MALPPALHFSLSVRDMDRSKAFYTALLGAEPVKIRPDYIKFETSEPAVVLSLIPGRSDAAGVVNHAGLRVPASEDLVKIQHRLEAGGIHTVREDGVACCYARQTKFWVTDPDKLLWEIYVFHEDLDEHGDGSVPEVERVSSAPAAPAPDRKVWSASLMQEVPDRIPHDSDWLHEVNLEGVGNRQKDLGAFYRDVWRALRPGGIIRLHGLSSDAPLANPSPKLPGPAAAVRYVPTHTEIVEALRAAGFSRVRFEMLSERGYFEEEGIQLREFRIEGFKPGHRPQAAAHLATYLGPFAEAVDDFGNRYPRGQRVLVNVHDWMALKDGPLSGSFLLSPPEAKAQPACCDGKDKMGV